MHAAQKILRQQFPKLCGFQCTLLSQKNGFLPVSSDCELHVTTFINDYVFLLVALWSHWVASASIGGEFKLYDNLAGDGSHQQWNSSWHLYMPLYSRLRGFWLSKSELSNRLEELTVESLSSQLHSMWHKVTSSQTYTLSRS